MRRPATRWKTPCPRPKRPTARSWRKEGHMNATLSRRQFLKTSAAVGGGLALEFSTAGSALAQFGMADSTLEVTHWIVVKPDDTVIIRIARSEIGQGSAT